MTILDVISGSTFVLVFTPLFIFASFLMSMMIFKTPLRKHHQKTFFARYLGMSFIITAIVVLPLCFIPVLAETNFVGLGIVMAAWGIHVYLTGRLLRGPKVLRHHKKQEMSDAFDLGV